MAINLRDGRAKLSSSATKQTLELTPFSKSERPRDKQNVKPVSVFFFIEFEGHLHTTSCTHIVSFPFFFVSLNNV